MAFFSTAQSRFRSSTTLLPFSSFSRRNFTPKPITVPATTTIKNFSDTLVSKAFKCNSSCSSSSSRDSEPTKPVKHFTVKNFSMVLAVSSTVTIVLNFGSFPSNGFSMLFGGNGSNWFGGGGSSGNNGNRFGSGGEDGGFWRRFFCSNAVADDLESQNQEWDTHGFPDNIVVQLDELSGLKNYKISEILLFDSRLRTYTIMITGNSFFEQMVSLMPGEIYTKDQLKEELGILANFLIFEKVEMEAKTNPDGTLGLIISFTEVIWEQAENFRCINAGLVPQSKPIENDPNMTDNEKLEMEMKEYKKKINGSRACLLPPSVQSEVLQLLKEQGKVSGRLLEKISERILKWYQDEGYIHAQTVMFTYWNNKEVVLEMAEGNITKVLIQIHDELGNVVEENTQLVALVKRELPKQLQSGSAFNIEVYNQGLKNLRSLGLFSNVEGHLLNDEKNKGVVVEIKLKRKIRE